MMKRDRGIQIRRSTNNMCAAAIVRKLVLKSWISIWLPCEERCAVMLVQESSVTSTRWRPYRCCCLFHKTSCDGKDTAGWDENTRHVREVAERLQDVGIVLVHHGRTRSQMYKGEVTDAYRRSEEQSAYPDPYLWKRRCGYSAESA
jgi:hypothetical protein